MDVSRPSLLAAMYESILDGDEEAAADLAREAPDSGVEPLTAIDEGFVPGIREAGRLFEEGEYFLPELVTAAQAMAAAMAVLRPVLEAGTASRSRGRVVIGTVPGDIHDIGKTLVGALLAANGFEVHDEGVDVEIERFVDRARSLDADLVCASALLTTTMAAQRRLVAAVRDAGLRARVLVGGAPVTEKWAAEIGADGFADNAVAAVDLARRVVAR
jgi:corrinoid protein of di/trimethylamine methyltransferase